MPRTNRDAEEVEYRLRNDLTDRPGIWHICWSEPGSYRSKRVSTGQTSKAAAREYRRQWLIDRNLPPALELRTVAELLDAYLENRQGNVADIQRLRDACKPLNAELGEMVPSELDEKAIAAYRAARNSMSAWTVRKELGTLISALNFGHRKGWYAEVPEIDLGPKPPSRTNWLKPGEAAALLDAAYQTMHLWLFIVLALNSRARKGAILALTWERVDFDTGRIDFKEPGRAETHKRRTVVPMTASARAALLEAREMARSDYVIEWNGKRVADIKTGLRSAVRRAGLENVSAHTLKHTCVSWLAQGNVSMEKAGELTATDPVTLREIYRHFDPEHLSDVAATLDSFMPQLGQESSESTPFLPQKAPETVH